MSSGLLILDNNAFKQLAQPEAVVRLQKNIRTVDLIVQPTEVNLLEITAAPEHVRTRLIAALRQVAPGMALLPWPVKLLQEIGQAIVSGQPAYRAKPSGSEWYLNDPDALREIHEDVVGFNRNLEAAFSELHNENRQKVRDHMRRSSSRNDVRSAREFLDRYWVGSELRRIYAEVTWSALELPGVAPIDTLEKSEAWRLLLDAEGVATYERAAARKQPKVVQRMDLFQLIYLAGARRRVLATSDISLLRVSAAILTGRYPNARAVSVATMIE